MTDLGAERIGHGLHAVTDPHLLDHLAEQDITLEVCLTSNVRTGAVPSRLPYVGQRDPLLL